MFFKITKCMLFGTLLMLFGCEKSSTQVDVTQTEVELRALLNIPDHFAIPAIPEENMPTAAKIELGRHLFYDTRLSFNNTMSCESCHEQDKAFSDGVARPVGATGEQLVRNSQGLVNAMYHASFTWANNGFTHIEDQLDVPIRADNPVELGVTEVYADEVLARFDADPAYVQMFANAFPESETGASVNKIIFALASFVRTIVSGDSPFDRFLLGDDNALTDQQKQGFVLFNGEKFECFHCHTGTQLTTSYRDYNTDPANAQNQFFNTGLYNLSSEGDYPAEDQGLFDLTNNPADKGFFRPQSLRNVAVTAPYMHDGSIATLREVLAHYARGGRLIESGPYAGDGRLNPLKSDLVPGFNATDEEIDAVIAFLESLTDESVLTNPALSNPFE
ncbi:MAG: MbnH family di-heme enzyme [Pseudomonadota bacterium]|nr:MbnH family di-heme enzyme [Pseudomonadota bacterium]